MKQDAKLGVTTEGQATVTREDGRTLSLTMDDTFTCWWQVVTWNWTHPSLNWKHKRRLLADNLKTLFTKVIWRKIRR